MVRSIHVVHEGALWGPHRIGLHMTYEWTNAEATNHGNGASGTVGVAKLAVVVSAPNSSARLVRTEWHMVFNCAGTATGVAITPDWPLDQRVNSLCVAQFAGSTAVPDAFATRDPNTVLVAPLVARWANQSFATSQGSVILDTGGQITSHAERMTPPAGGWQVAAGFTWNDDAGFVTGFGSNFRWNWRAEIAALWRL
jgi:hypothetical protein